MPQPTIKEQRQKQLKIRTLIFIILFIILAVPILSYLVAIMKPKTKTITANQVSKNTDGIFPKYVAHGSYNVWIFSGEYDIKITKSEYQQALKNKCEIKEINYNQIGAQSISHATWTLLPRIIALTILTTIYLIDLYHNKYLFTDIKKSTDMWSEPDNKFFQ